MKLAREEDMNLSYEDFNLFFQNLDPRGTGYIPMEAIKRIRAMQTE